jgi:acyl-CoA thioesterase-1
MDRRPDVAVVELGGNDGLQALSLESMEANLSAIVEALQARGIRVVLLGVELPFFLGDTSGFRAVYGRVADEYDVPLLDNVLEDVTGYPGRMQADGIHPTPEGHAIMAERVTDFLESSGVLD